MRVILQRKDFSKALALLSKAAVRRSYIGTFCWVKLKAFVLQDEKLMLQTTTGEVYLTLLVPAEIIEEGEVCVEVFALHDAVKSSKDSQFIELYTAQDKLVVKTNTFTQKLELKPVEFFPDFPTPQFQTSLLSSVLKYGIEKVRFAVAKEERGPLAHLFIDGQGDHVCFVGSDGHRLAVLRLDYEVDLKVMLYYKSLKLLKELLKLKHAEQVHIGYDDKFVYLTNGVWTTAVRVLSEARYPLYEAVVPPTYIYDVVVEVSRRDLASALENFKQLDKITIEFTDRKGFKIKTQDAETLVEADVHGDIGFSLDFNPRQLEEFTDVVGAYTYIEARFKNSDEVPAMFKVGDNYLYLVMPLIRKR